jgi:putative transposase
MALSNFPRELLRYSEWPGVAEDMVPAGQRRRFNRLKAAIEAACDGKPKAFIKRKWGVAGGQIDHLLERCTSQHEDGHVCGYRALTYYFRNKEYQRVSDLVGNEDGAGLAGAFTKLLQDHEQVHRWLDQRIRPAQGIGYREAGLRIASIHGEFLERLRADGVQPGEYPFSRSRAAYGALSDYISARVQEVDAVARALHGEDASAGLQGRSGKTGVTQPHNCYERVAYDEYELPNIATLVIESDGSEIDIPLSRAYFCPLVDFHSDAVLGYDVSVSLRIQSINLLQAVESSIKPLPPRRVNAFADYPISPGEGLPGFTIPEARGRRISVLVVDNHLTHLANPVVGHLRRQTGMTISYGQVRRWIGRAIVEGLFSELQVQLSRLASTTGSGPRDPAVNDPVGKAVRNRIRLTSLLDLLDILVGRHNAKRLRRLKMRTPNEVIAADCRGSPALAIVPAFEDDFIARPGIAVEIVTRCVRGNRAKSKHPYVQLDEAEYTNDILRQSWHMVNKVTLTLHIRKDMRSVRAFLPDGTEFGQLEVCDHWKNSAHDRETRKEINRLYREGKIAERGHDPVTHYQNSLARDALLKAKRGKLSREAGQLARSLAANPGSATDPFRFNVDTVPEPKKPSAKSRGRRSYFEGDEP